MFVRLKVISSCFDMSTMLYVVVVTSIFSSPKYMVATDYSVQVYKIFYA